jgi:hypothetical protein
LKQHRALEMFKPQSSQPISMQICNVLTKNYLHQLDRSCHPVCRTSFASRTEISRFSRTLPRHFRIMISDATDGRSEITYFWGGGEGSLTVFEPAESSSDRTALLRSSAADCSLVYECPGSCYRRAVFLGNDLAAQGSPCSPPPHREGAILGPVRPGLLPGTLESIDKHQYCGYATRSKSFLFRPCLPAQWTALNSWWTPRHLCGATYCLRV